MKYKYLFYLLLFLLLTGLNDYLSSVNEENYLLSPVILILAIALIFGSLSLKNSLPQSSKNMILFFIIYFAIGAISSVYNNEPDDVLRTLRYYIPSIMILYISSVFFTYLFFHKKSKEVIILLLTFLSINNILITLSTFAKSSLLFIIESEGRYSGNLTNPNEAAFSAASSLIIILFYSNKLNRLLFLSLASLAIAAIIVTFSKTGFILLIPIILSFAFIYSSVNENIRRFSNINYKKSIIKSNKSLFLISITIGFIVFFSAYFSKLTDEQYLRFSQTKEVIKGKITAENTTKRSEIFEYCYQKVMESPIIGNGLWKFHEIKILGFGSHNIFLLLWGESGIIVLILFLLILFFEFKHGFMLNDSKHRFLVISYILILVIFGFTNHNILYNKLQIVFLSFVFSISSASKEIN